MDESNGPDDFDARRYYTPKYYERKFGVPARVTRAAPDLPRLVADGWNRINGQDFLDWRAKHTRPGAESSPRADAIRARVADQIRREQAPAP